jgi:hypothetical protein
MPRITDDQEVLHTLPLWLYPSHLPDMQGKYLVRPKGLQMLSTRDLCVKAVKDGYPGSVDDMEYCVKWFLDTAAFDLLDGYGVNFGGYFSTRLKVDGILDSELAAFVPENHPANFTFSVLGRLRRLLSRIHYRLEGTAGDGTIITEVIDITTGLVNEKITPNGAFTILGTKLKIVGDPVKTGIFFVAPDMFPVQVTAPLIENNPTRIIAIAPDLPADKEWTVQVRTQFVNGTTLLKEPRTIESDFTLTLPIPRTTDYDKYSI